MFSFDPIAKDKMHYNDFQKAKQYQELDYGSQRRNIKFGVTPSAIALLYYKNSQQR